MAQNPLVEQAKLGNVNAIASLMNRLLKSQGMLANVEREDDCLEILIESDLRSLNDEVRIPKRQILVGMLKKWFVTLEVQTVSSIKISWQQTGADQPAWTEEIFLVEPDNRDISQNGGITEPQRRPKIQPLPVFPSPPMHESNLSSDRAANQSNPPSSSPDLDEMFGEINSPKPFPNTISVSNLNSDLSFDLSSDLESSKSPQDEELLFFADVPPTPEPQEEISSFQSEPPFEPQSELTSPSRSSSPAWQTLIKTPSFAIQFLQYCVICAIIILTLRGLHAALGSNKAPKAASIAPQTILM